MYKVAITGSTGLVGSRVVELLRNDFEFIELTHDTVDITDASHVHKVLSYLNFDFFLHVAAYTNVDKAEIEDKELAYKMNVEATKNLFDASQGKKAKFIYISTDYVFDGTQPPYDEDSHPHPLNVYGQTKYEGEEVVKGQGMIIRPSFPYRAAFEKKKDFVRTIKWLLEQGRGLKMVTDAVNTPTFIDDFAYGVKHLIENYSPEIFHLNGADSLTPYEEGLLIAKVFGLDSNLIGKTTLAEFYKGKAPRPIDTSMKSKKNNFYKMKTFEEGLHTIKVEL